jgi:hypothetical protein
LIAEETDLKALGNMSLQMTGGGAKSETKYYFFLSPNIISIKATISHFSLHEATYIFWFSWLLCPPFQMKYKN